MLVTLEESKFDKSISMILVIPWNIFSQDSIKLLNFIVILFKPATSSQLFLHEGFDISLIMTSEGSL